jgi:hypothetical protein
VTRKKRNHVISALDLLNVTSHLTQESYCGVARAAESAFPIWESTCPSTLLFSTSTQLVLKQIMKTAFSQMVRSLLICTRPHDLGRVGSVGLRGLGLWRQVGIVSSSRCYGLLTHSMLDKECTKPLENSENRPAGNESTQIHWYRTNSPSPKLVNEFQPKNR